MMFWRNLARPGFLRPTGTRAYSNEKLLDLLNTANSKSASPRQGVDGGRTGGQGSGINRLARVARPPVMHSIPRTGTLVGRSVLVKHPSQLTTALAQLNAINKVNKMSQVKRLQRFAERPGKARLRIRIERKRREFKEGIRRLFDLVNDAQRQGYGYK